MKTILRLIDIIPHQLETYPSNNCISDKTNGVWKKFTTSEVKNIVDRFSLGLLKLGFQPGDKFAIVSPNRTEWNFVDLGVLQIGGIVVPVYPTISADEYEYIFNDAEVKLAFVGSDELYHKVHTIKPKVKSLQEIYLFNHVEGKKYWTEILNIADESLRPRLNEIEDSITPNDLATIIYTSGTTGTPKGVMLSHNNIISNVTSLSRIFPINQAHRVISFLPICHIFERTSIYFYLTVGASIYYAESIEKVGENLLEVKPNYFTTVPRLLEKIFDKIMDKGRDLQWPKKSIFGWAVNLANNYNPEGKNNSFYNLRLRAARKLVFSKWLAALGGEVKGIICGAAALQPRLARIFTAVGIPICEGYGLTESSPVITCNRFNEGEYSLGTVGFPIPDVQIKIGENGEILAKGPNIMIGYYNKPEYTKASIDDEGWLHTGDVGELVNGKYLRITDRLKEIFKTSGGKFIAPLPIENKMKESLFIRNIMVIGENRNFSAALIIPEFDFIKKWSKKKKLGVLSNEEICKNPIVKERIWEDVQKYNERFSKVEQIKKIELLSNDWTIESNELTPTIKLKRKTILNNNKELIEKIYST